MTILFWDIDGTLLTTGKAGVPAWETAVRETTGREFQLSSIRIAGLTDYQIAVRTFEMLEFSADAATLERMVRRYEELLPSTLPSRQGRVLPNVREILDVIAGRPDVRVLDVRHALGGHGLVDRELVSSTGLTRSALGSRTSTTTPST